MMVTLRTVATVVALVVLAACSTAHPTAPTAPAAAEPWRFTGNLTGEWTGTYVVTGCSPVNAPNPCTNYVPTVPGTMRLSLTQTGATLAGTFASDQIGAIVPVTGTVDDFGIVHLEGKRPGSWRCFFGGARDLALGSWTTQITKSGGLAGSFKQSVQQTLSSCYTTMFAYDTSVISLTRS